jgi:polysaccharide chain length determinant protein (PEP-CTERM system associated)
MKRDRQAGNGAAEIDRSFDDPEDESFDWTVFRHYLHAPLRRPLVVVAGWAAVIALSVLALLFFPKKYRSATLILVESEKVPESFVTKVATPDKAQKLEAIHTEILSRTRLERVIDETNPYPTLESRPAAVEALRRSISINVSGQDGFTVEFVHTDPHKAQQVASRLATLFIEETIAARAEQVEGAVDFLATQVSDAKKELEQKEEALRVYKESRMGRLPEQLQTNLATLQMLQQEARTVEENLIFAREKRDSLARGGARLQGAVANGGGQSTAAEELSVLRNQLALLRTRYTDEHPDVESLRLKIARLEQRLAGMVEPTAVASSDPTEILAREQLEQGNLEVKRLEEKRADLESRVAAIRARVEETPRTEQELAGLKRDYDKLNENYVSMLSKQLDARMAGRLERRWKSDRFRILDPASLPEKPYFPKPWMFIGLGVALGLFAGLGASLIAEYVDPTIKDAQDLASLQAYPILARIPHVPSLGGRTA